MSEENQNKDPIPSDTVVTTGEEGHEEEVRFVCYMRSV